MVDPTQDEEIKRLEAVAERMEVAADRLEHQRQLLELIADRLGSILTHADAVAAQLQRSVSSANDAAILMDLASRR